MNELSQDDKKTYLDMLAYYIDTKVNSRFRTIGNTQSDVYRNGCYQTLINGDLNDINCKGSIIPKTHTPLFFQGFAEFLQNFRFPKDSPELSLPMLEFASDPDLTSMLSYRANTDDNKFKGKCTFRMGLVDKTSFANIQYRENTSVDTPDDDAAPQIGYDPLLEFLIKNNVVNKELGYGPTLIFNLGVIQKPTDSENGVRSSENIDSLRARLYFMRNTARGTKLLIILVIDREALADGSRGCKFAIDEVLTGGIINKWTWSGKINDLKFYPTCQSYATASSGGRKRRRLSKTKKVRARSTRRRRNNKKLKRSVYVKAGNTKRKLRRFRH